MCFGTGITEFAESSERSFVAGFGDKPPWRSIEVRMRSGLNEMRGDVLRHKKHTDRGCDSKPILGTEDSVVCPSIGIHTRRVQNERHCKRSKSVCQSRQRSQHAS
jgi:hypothetical protein